MRPPSRTLAGRLAEDAHRALARALEPEHEPQQGRLAAAVRPRDRDELARARRRARHPRARGRPPGSRTRRRRARRRGCSARASQRLPEGGEVRAHDREVVGPGGDLALADPLERIEHGRLRRRPRGPPSPRASARAASRRTRSSRRSLRTTSTSRAMSLRRRLGLRREPFERHLLEPVAGREISEGGVARHDLAAGAVGEAASVLARRARRACGPGVPPAPPSRARCRSAAPSRRSAPDRARRGGRPAAPPP